MPVDVADLINKIHILNRLRRKRAIHGMPDSFRFIYSNLIYLLHFNHISLPGFEEQAPCGIYNNHEFCRASSILLLPEIKSLCATKQNTKTTPIFGVYSMGSTASLGQSIYSDLDIWLCIDKTLNIDKRHKLRRKCQKLELWAKSYGVDLKLFIVDEERFYQKCTDNLDQEHCGSTQHILLLEEFYRTATRLAGKPLLWFIVPFFKDNETHFDYEKMVTHMCEQGCIDRQQWIDFGPLTALSSKEYYGASLWQIYKSIDSPYKSVLKALLLEVYISTYPSTELLAAEMRALLPANNKPFFHLDHYYIMLERITRYLAATDDNERIELVRHCFYLKVGECLTKEQQTPSWRRRILIQLTKSWGWSKAYIAGLDNQPFQKIEKIKKEYDLLFNAIMKSYRNLNRFGRRYALTSAVSPQDMSVLTRKLYAAYESLPDKVVLFAPSIIGSLAQLTLTFIHISEGGVNRTGWYLYDKAPVFDEIISHQPIEYSRNLVKVFSWCYFNGMLSKDTQLYLHSKNRCDINKFNRFFNDMRSFFPVIIPPASEEALREPSRIRQMAIILNMERDPTYYLDRRILQQEKYTDSAIDILNFGLKQQSLIGSIDIIYRNSWNEVRVMHFEGEHCVIEAIETVLGKIYKGSGLPDFLAIYDYSEHFSEQIFCKTQELVEQCIKFRIISENEDRNRFKPLRIAGKTWGMVREPYGIKISQFQNGVDFYAELLKYKIEPFNEQLFNTFNILPTAIENLASEGIIQFFFDDTDTGFDLYILNEINHVEVFRNCCGNKEGIICDINYHHALLSEKEIVNNYAINFNFPQFYQLVEKNGKKQAIPFHS